jgi:hypothetical protein
MLTNPAERFKKITRVKHRCYAVGLAVHDVVVPFCSESGYNYRDRECKDTQEDGLNDLSKLIFTNAHF